MNWQQWTERWKDRQRNVKHSLQMYEWPKCQQQSKRWLPTTGRREWIALETCDTSFNSDHHSTTVHQKWLELWMDASTCKSEVILGCYCSETVPPGFHLGGTGCCFLLFWDSLSLGPGAHRLRLTSKPQGSFCLLSTIRTSTCHQSAFYVSAGNMVPMCGKHLAN